MTGTSLHTSFLSLNKQVSIVEYKNLPHGFLNFDIFPFLADESNKAIKQSAMWFKLEMTKSSKNKHEFYDDSNHVIYKNNRLDSEEQIVEHVQSEVSFFTRVLNRVTLPFLKLLF